jgi:UDP-GlcNAc:undecaprenyl-phosphate GlcNAc-1-phosphate transferase
MSILLLILGSSFGLCLILTPLARALAARYGLVDHPDRRRKMHDRAIPVAGGLALLLSGSAAVLAARVAPNRLRDHLALEDASLFGLLLAIVVIAIVGVIDDLRGLRGRHKLLGQLAALAIVMSSGLVVRNIRLFDWQLELGLLAVPFTAFWLLGAINALNLIDGMDGLLGCVALIVSLTIAVMAVQASQWAAACVAVALAGGLLGFLRYNLPPATIFLGNSGSMLIGLVVGVLAIKSSLKTPVTIGLAAPVAVLTIPILDTAAAIARRKLSGRSVYTTDRGHLHHCLLRRGLDSPRVLVWVACLCLVTVLGALASLAFKNELFAIVASLAVACMLIATRVFGYAEFMLAKERLTEMATSLVQRTPPGKPHQLEIRLQGSANWKELWQALTACGVRFNLKTIHLDVNAPAVHEGYHARWDRRRNDADVQGLWRLEIPLLLRSNPLSEDADDPPVAGGSVPFFCVGRLAISGYPDAEPTWIKMTALAKLVESLQATVAKLAAGEPGVRGQESRARAEELA